MATGPRRSSRLASAAVAIVSAVLFVALSPATAQRRDTVVLGMAQEPDTLIDSFATMGASSAILNSLFVTMVQRDDQARLVPRLIEKIPTLTDGDWQILPGKKVRLTFRLRRGYTWHDGRPVTALDASWTYLMLRNPRSPTLTRFILNKIENVFVPHPNDPYILVVQWNELYPFAYNGIGGYGLLPRHVMEREYLADPSRLNRHRQGRAPVGNGPYRFVEWVPGSHITLEAYAQFPEGAPRISRQVWRFILDSTVLQANVIAGQVDVAVVNNFSIDQMVDIERRSPQVAAHYLPSLNWEHIRLNLDNEWLKDRRIRQALIRAINRDEMSQRLFHGKSQVAHTWLPPGHDGRNPNVRKYAHDPATARQLLMEAGFRPGSDGILRDTAGRPFELVIMTTAGNAIREQTQEVMKAQLRAVGIDLKIDNRPASVLFGTITRRRQFPHMAMFSTTMSPIQLGFAHWHSSQIPSAANSWEGSNSSGWRNAENDRLLEQIAEELDIARRTQMLRRQQEIWVEELPAVPLFFNPLLATAKKALKNVKPGVLTNLL